MIPDGAVLNSNRNLINLQNGMYDTETGAIYDCAPSYYSTLKLNYPHDPAAECPRWLQFLEETLPDDLVARGTLQEAFGYSLVPDTSREKSFFIYGQPLTGKSRVLMVLEALVGHENSSRVPLNKISEPFFTVRLHNKLINISTEIETPEIENTESFKQIVSGEPVEACHKFKDFFKFIPFARLWWASNNQTKWRDTSGAIDRRLLIFNFNTSFQGREDFTLIDKLTAELSGIFNWSIVGLNRLRERGYFQESEIMKKQREEVVRSSNLCFAFVSEKCALDKYSSCFRSDLYAAYHSWSLANGFKNPVSSSKFTRDLQRAFPQIEAPETAVRRGRTLDRTFIGLSLIPEQYPLDESYDE
jgi:putative DNA primase/helicase